MDLCIFVFFCICICITQFPFKVEVQDATLSSSGVTARIVITSSFLPRHNTLPLGNYLFLYSQKIYFNEKLQKKVKKKMNKAFNYKKSLEAAVIACMGIEACFS